LFDRADANDISEEVLRVRQRIETWFQNFLRSDMQLDENILSKDDYARALKANATSKTKRCSGGAPAAEHDDWRCHCIRSATRRRRHTISTKFGVRGHVRAWESGDMSPHSKIYFGEACSAA
jgi:hypothetical protein